MKKDLSKVKRSMNMANENGKNNMLLIFLLISGVKEPLQVSVTYRELQVNSARVWGKLRCLKFI